MKIIYLSGGGKDLATAAAIMESREQKFKQEDVKPELKMGHLPMGYNPKMGANMHPSTYDMMRNPPSKWNRYYFDLGKLFFILIVKANQG